MERPILTHSKALRVAQSMYFSTLKENNEKNSRFLFNTVAELTSNKTITGTFT